MSSYGAVGASRSPPPRWPRRLRASCRSACTSTTARTRSRIDACLALGYSSVMIDGSQLPFDENVAVTRRVVERAHAAGAWVEAELGALSGDEDTRPGEAEDGRDDRPR